MSVSDEQYERVCNFADELITEKHSFMNRAFLAERRLILWRAIAIPGWALVFALALSEFSK